MASAAPGATREGGRPLHLDCYSGAAGNMILGALLSAGASPDAVRRALGALGIPGLEMRVESVKRGALRAEYVSFAGPERSPAERRYREIRDLLTGAPLPEGVRALSLEVFRVLGEAEARVHGIDIEKVHFHEVGAVDTLGDVVGVAAALEDLAISRVTCSEIGVGSGTVDTEHGRLPLPAPASVELLRGVPTRPLDVRWETITPTGAALLRARVDRFGPMDALVPRAQGFGAGSDRPGPMPNLVRAILGEADERFERDAVTVIETHLDDMSPEGLPFLIERLMEAGALDAALLPLVMKKGRPGQLLRVIARPGDALRLSQEVMAHSTAIGLRYTDAPRLVLRREVREFETAFGPIAVKLVSAPGAKRRAAPEYESCARAAREHGVSLAEVVRAAERAAESRDG